MMNLFTCTIVDGIPVSLLQIFSAARKQNRDGSHQKIFLQDLVEIDLIGKINYKLSSG